MKYVQIKIDAIQKKILDKVYLFFKSESNPYNKFNSTLSDCVYGPKSTFFGYCYIPSIFNKLLNMCIHYFIKCNAGNLVKYVVLLLFLNIGKSSFAADTLRVRMDLAKAACSKRPVQFTDISSTNGVIVSWYWDFNDGNFSTQQNPRHSYVSSGRKKVKLRIKLQSGLVDSIEQFLTIHNTPTSYYTTTGACENIPILFDNLSLPGPMDSTYWVFPDTTIKFRSFNIGVFKTFSIPGSHTIKLIMQDTSGCRDTFSDTIQVFKTVKANFKYSPAKPCLNDTILFTALPNTKYSDTLKYLWDLGSGFQSTDSQFYYKYAVSTTKTFLINLNIRISNSCSDSVIKPITLYENPEPVYIFIDTLTKLSQRYFKFWPTINNVKPEFDEWGVKYNWVVYRSKSDSVIFNNQNSIEIPDTFTTTNGLHVRLTAVHNSGCRWIDEIFNFSGIGHLVGKVFDDLDSNRYFNGSDTLLKNVIVKCSGIKRKFYVATDEKGEFRVNIFEKDSLQFAANRIDRFAKFYKQSKNVSLFYSPDSSYSHIQIPMYSSKYKDFELLVYGNSGSALIKGEEQKMYLELRNNSPVVLNSAKIILKFDGALSRLKSSEKFTITTGNPTVAQFSGLSVAPLGKRIIPFSLYIHPDSNNINDKRKIEAYFKDNMDSISANDTSVLNGKVLAAYDPNIKESVPNGTIQYAINRIKYTILFQNEGNSKARNVVLRDTIDPRFELSSVYLTEAVTDNYKVSVDNGNTLVFTFENINLPPKSELPDKSKGFISFYMNLSRPFKNGDSVQNRAGIYFDYEKVVLTPWANLVRNDTLSNNIEVQRNKRIYLYPVPVYQQFTLHFETEFERNIEIYNSAGVLVRKIKSLSTNTEMDVSELADGIYFIRTNLGDSGTFMKVHQ